VPQDALKHGTLDLRLNSIPNKVHYNKYVYNYEKTHRQLSVNFKRHSAKKTRHTSQTIT